MNPLCAIIHKIPRGYKLFVAVFVALNAAWGLHAQTKADTLLMQAQKSGSDSLKVKLMNDAVWELMFRDKEKAGQIAKQAYAIAQKTGNIHSLSDCYNTLGVFYYINSDFPTALEYHRKALDVRIKLKDTIGLMKTYNNLASVLKEQGDYKTEVDYYFKSLDIARRKRDTLSEARILSNVAGAFRNQQQYERSEEYHLMSLKLYKLLNNVPGEISLYIGLGALNSDWHRFEAAEDYLKKAGELLSTSGDNFTLAKYHANYATVLTAMKRFDEARGHLETSVECNNRIGNQNSNLANYFNLGNLYHHLRRLDDAFAAYTKGYDLALKIGNRMRQKECLLGLSNIYAEKGNIDKAFDFRLMYEVLKDSLQAEETNQLFADAEAKYQVSAKEAEIRLLAEKNENTTLQLKQRSYAIAIIIVIFLLICMTAYFVWRQQRMSHRRRMEQKIREAEETERVRIAKDIHDELGSGLTKIRFMSELAASAYKDDTVKAISGTAAGLVENMRDLIWVMNPANTKLDNLVARIREYSSDYLEEFPVELSIDFPADIEAINITKEAHRNIFMVVKEALQNVVKHSNATKLNIRLKIDDDFDLTIEDNGKGFDPVGFSEGNGLRNMRTRMEAISGRLTVKSETGRTAVRLQVATSAITKL